MCVNVYTHIYCLYVICIRTFTYVCKCIHTYITCGSPLYAAPELMSEVPICYIDTQTHTHTYTHTHI